MGAPWVWVLRAGQRLLVSPVTKNRWNTRKTRIAGSDTTIAVARIAGWESALRLRLQRGERRHHGLVVRTDCERDPEEELVPDVDELEHEGRDEGRAHKRQVDADEHPPPAGAVELRRLTDLGRNRDHEVARHEEGEGDAQRDVDDDEDGPGVVQAEASRLPGTAGARTPAAVAECPRR